MRIGLIQHHQPIQQHAHTRTDGKSLPHTHTHTLHTHTGGISLPGLSVSLTQIHTLAHTHTHTHTHTHNLCVPRLQNTRRLRQAAVCNGPCLFSNTEKTHLGCDFQKQSCFIPIFVAQFWSYWTLLNPRCGSSGSFTFGGTAVTENQVTNSFSGSPRGDPHGGEEGELRLPEAGDCLLGV